MRIIIIISILCIDTPFLVIHMHCKKCNYVYVIRNTISYSFWGRGLDIGTVYISIPVPSDSVSRRGPRFHVRENDLYAPAYTHARYRSVV